MSTVERAATLVSRSLGYLGMAGIAALLILISADVFFRYALNSPLLFAEEISGYLVAIIGYFGAAETLRTNRHIRVEVLLNRFSEPIRVRLNVAAHVIGLVVITVFGWHVIAFLDKAFTRGTTSASMLAVPLWIPQAAMLIGMAAFLLQIVVETRRSFDIARTSKKGRPT